MRMMLGAREVVKEAADRWWLFLLSGIAWLVFWLIIFQWDYTTVYAISYLFGFVALFAGVNEFALIAISTTGWKIMHGILGVLFVIAGILGAGSPAQCVRDARGAGRLLLPLQRDRRPHGLVHRQGRVRVGCTNSISLQSSGLPVTEITVARVV
jgi:cell division protein FtsW (lipid II flippase)